MKSFKNIPSMNDILNYHKIQDFSDYKNSVLKKLINKIISDIKNEMSFSDKFDSYSKEDFSNHIYMVLKNDISLIQNRYRKLINATGVILHTNIGRAPIDKEILEKAADISSSYINVEYDINSGKRADRNFAIADLLSLLTGCEDAVVLNNNAAALLLISQTFCDSKNLLISRGEIIEIGSSFRILDILQIPNVDVREVGSTNRTYLSDYEDNIDENTSVILKVTKSNYNITGFSAEVSQRELADLSHKNKLIFVEDLGSGTLVDMGRYGLENCRSVEDAINDGTDLLCFSTDKFMSSAQGAIVAGKKKYIDKLKKHPMYRALRIGKNTSFIIYETLKSYLKNDISNIPIISILSQSDEQLYEKSKRLLYLLDECKEKIEIFIEKGSSPIGGGTSSDVVKSTYVVCIRPKYLQINDFQKKMRYFGIISNINNGYLKLDVMCLQNEDIDYVAKSVINILNCPRASEK